VRRAPIWPLQALRVAFGQRPPFALCYHGVGRVAPGADPHALFIGPEAFAEQLDVLAAQGYAVVGAGELGERVARGDGDGVGAVTFDDGLAQTARAAAPLLAERGMRASMFVTTGLMGGVHPHVGGAEPIMTPAEVVELAAAGFEIGSHAVDHVPLPELSDAELRDQLRRSRAVLEDLLGRAVTTMAYPFGAHDERVVEAAREAGYEVACGCSGSGPWDPLRLPREPVFPSLTPLRLRLKAAGLYGPVHRLAGLRGRWAARRDR
jgi:peptidoglycan/xylan/chitin deacetylase (PgdA/CDA1 family)